MEQKLCSLYKMYFENKNKDFRIYVKSFIIGGDPLVKIIPAENKEDAGLFEKDKAEGYMKIIGADNLGMEEVNIYIKEENDG